MHVLVSGQMCACARRNGDRFDLLRHHSHPCLALGPPAVNGPKAAGNQKGSATDLGTGYRAAQRAWESASGRQLYLKKRTACVR